jgi:hypothetical protein
MEKKLRDKLDERIDRLQEMMESNYHLSHPTEARTLVLQITYAWSVLSEEDRDYVQVAIDAIEEGWEWGEVE